MLRITLEALLLHRNTMTLLQASCGLSAIAQLLVKLYSVMWRHIFYCYYMYSAWFPSSRKLCIMANELWLMNWRILIWRNFIISITVRECSLLLGQLGGTGRLGTHVLWTVKTLRWGPTGRGHTKRGKSRGATIESSTHQTAARPKALYSVQTNVDCWRLY